jgi:hypothetical protein
VLWCEQQFILGTPQSDGTLLLLCSCVMVTVNSVCICFRGERYWNNSYTDVSVWQFPHAGREFSTRPVNAHLRAVRYPQTRPQGLHAPSLPTCSPGSAVGVLAVPAPRARHELVCCNVDLDEGKTSYVCPWRRMVGGIGDVPPRILNLGTRYRGMLRFTPRPLYS